MTIAALRKSLGLSQATFAGLVGLRSKGQISEIENGARQCSPRVAVEIEKLSGGSIRAVDISPSIAKVDAARGEAV